MFAVIYSFKVKTGRDRDFRSAWKELTKLIREYEGSHGSRLHRESENTYIAYALWPNRKKWEEFGSNLPASADEVRERMREACVEIRTLHELEVTDDLLGNRVTGEAGN